MKILEKIDAKQHDMYGKEAVTVAFIGDSVTQGCFECYFKSEDRIETVFDYNSVYSTRFKELLAKLYPNVQINIINSGISGDTAAGCLRRLERDVLRFSPDLVVVSCGLNDCVTGGEEKLSIYAEALRSIFVQCKEHGAECIMLTECMMNDHVSPYLLSDSRMGEFAEKFMNVQKSGLLNCYFEKAVAVAKESGVAVCDQYAVWKAMYKAGVNTTELLANKLNHPIREWHYYIAVKLLETVFEI